MSNEYNESALPIGAVIQEYKIESILGVGGFGITYLAKDINLHKFVVIKEYLPNELAVRKESSTVVPKTRSDKENFEWGLERFLQEAQTLAKFNHPNIVRISRFFRANDTAYFVMDYEEGQDLGEYLQSKQRNLSEEEVYNIIMPILDGLREVHSHDFLHRDIKPANIFIRESGSPMLIDFGASRFAMGAKSKSLSVVLTEGYAPKEQYSSTSKQGAYTDIYAIGAVMYKMATGKVPPESSARADAITDDEADPYHRLQDMVNISYGDNFKKAVDWALEFRGKDRPQSVRELQDVLMNGIVDNKAKDNTQTIKRDINKVKKKSLVNRIFTELFIITNKKDNNGTAIAIYWGICLYILFIISLEFFEKYIRINELLSIQFLIYVVGTIFIMKKIKRKKEIAKLLFIAIIFLNIILSGVALNKENLIDIDIINYTSVMFIIIYFLLVLQKWKVLKDEIFARSTAPAVECL